MRGIPGFGLDNWALSHPLGKRVSVKVMLESQLERGF
jgi:hypothetical protein